MVKLVTSVAAMQLVEQGRIKLDEPVPGIDRLLAAPQVLAGYDAAGAPEVRPASGPITLRHLLTHTAGITYRLWDAQALHHQHAFGARAGRSVSRATTSNRDGLSFLMPSSACITAPNG
jgi:methyl acetate hydrolase